MSTSKRVIKNTLFLYVRTLVSLLVSLVTTRVLLNALGETDYGLYNVVGGSISMLGFLSASMGSATQRFLSLAEGKGDKERIKSYFNNAIILHYGLAVLMVVVLAVSGIVFFNGILNIPEGKRVAAIIVYICMMISTVFSITIVPYDADINAHENMLFYSLLGIFDVFFKLGVAIAVSYFDWDRLIFYAVLMAIGSFINRSVAQTYCKRHYPECNKTHLRKYFDKKVIHEMTSFAGWNLVNVATGLMSIYGVTIIINHYFGSNVNAAMGIATQLSGVMIGLSFNMLKAVSPVIVKAEGGNNHEQMLMYSYASCKFEYLIFSIVCVPVIFFINDILAWWLKVVPEWTSIFCVVLIVATLIELLTIAFYQGIMANGDIRNYNIVSSVCHIIPLIISVCMFQYGDFPPYWVFINMGIWKSVIKGAVNVMYAKHIIGIKYGCFFRKVLIPSMTCTIISAILFFMLATDGLLWWINIGIGFIVSIFIYYFIALNSMEKAKVLMFVPIINKIRID